MPTALPTLWYDASQILLITVLCKRKVNVTSCYLKIMVSVIDNKDVYSWVNYCQLQLFGKKQMVMYGLFGSKGQSHKES